VRIAAPDGLILVLLATAYAMAISSTLSGAVMVENGQQLGRSDAFVNQQWLWFNLAAMPSSLLGGELIEHLSLGGALHAAAAITAAAPFAAIFAAAFLIDEAPSRLDLVSSREPSAACLQPSPCGNSGSSGCSSFFIISIPASACRCIII
jgi:hypothetical protein